MYIDTVWIKRVGSENDFPELVVAMDEYTAETCDKTIGELADAELERWKLLGDEISQRETVRIRVAENDILAAFDTQIAEGLVES